MSIVANNKIFIKIPSYRDVNLVKTVFSAIKNADAPNLLTFGLCVQDEPEILENPIFKMPNIQFNFVHWTESHGLAWARSVANLFYDGEQFSLQIDAHHEFVKGWDSILKNDLSMLQVPLPLITGYPPDYSPDDGTYSRLAPSVICANRFDQGGVLRVNGKLVAAAKNGACQVPARFVAGGFLFTLGRHCLDCPPDPAMEPPGEEIALTVRSFTMGYDLFHPMRPCLWHYYHPRRLFMFYEDRSGVGHNGLPSVGDQMREVMQKRMRQLLMMRDYGVDLGIYGLGKARSLADYESYSGIHFREQVIHPDAILGDPPPTAPFRKSDLKVRTFTLNLGECGGKVARLLDCSTKLVVGLLDCKGLIGYRKSFDLCRKKEDGPGEGFVYRVVIREQARIIGFVLDFHTRFGWQSPLFVDNLGRIKALS